MNLKVNATGRNPRLTARRFWSDKPCTEPSSKAPWGRLAMCTTWDDYPGLDISRAYSHLKNYCSGRHERNPSCEGNNQRFSDLIELDLTVNASGQGPNLTARRLGVRHTMYTAGRCSPTRDLSPAARHLKNYRGRHKRNPVRIGRRHLGQLNLIVQATGQQAMNTTGANPSGLDGASRW